MRQKIDLLETNFGLKAVTTSSFEMKFLDCPQPYPKVSKQRFPCISKFSLRKWMYKLYGHVLLLKQVISSKMKFSYQGWSNISSYTYPSGNFQTLGSNWRWLWPLKSILLETNLHLLEHQKVLRGGFEKVGQIRPPYSVRFIFHGSGPI